MFKGGVLEIGDGTLVEHGTSIAATGSVRIGRNCRLGAHTMIIDNDFHEIERREVMPPARPIVIGDSVWLGNRTIVLPGVTVGSHAIVIAGSVLTRDVPPRARVGGNPARLMDGPLMSAGHHARSSPTT